MPSETLTAVTHGPYKNAEELRRVSTRLVEELDRRTGTETTPDREVRALRLMEADIRGFLERGSATGAVIEPVRERTACQVLLDYWSSTLSHAGIQLDRKRLAPFDAAQLPVLPDAERPFVGLEPFRDPKYFFGRARAIEKLLRRVSDNPLVIVEGSAVSGKSSLVLAGVVPVLASPQHVPAYRVVGPLVPGGAVIEALLAAAGDVTGRAPATAQEVADCRAEPAVIARWLAAAGAYPALLVVDHCEELFTLNTERDQQAAAAALVSVLEANESNRVILIVRDDLSGALGALPSLARYLDRATEPRFSMQECRMGYDELRAAIEGPAAKANLQLAPGIVDEIVKSVLGLDTALPLLQFALRALWDHRDRNRITREVYEQVGPPLTALTRAAEAFYAEEPEDQGEIKRILLELIMIDRMMEAHRQPASRGTLVATDSPRTVGVLERLEKVDFVRMTSSRDGRDARVEVQNEALVRHRRRNVGHRVAAAPTVGCSLTGSYTTRAS
jgi:hypothetical protein